MQSYDRQEILAVFSNVLNRRKWLIVATIVVLLIPIVYYNETATPMYQSNTTVVFEEFRGNVSTIELNVSRELFFSNQLVEIKSFSFAEDIYQQLPSEHRDLFQFPDSTQYQFSRKGLIVSQIQGGIAALPVKTSGIIKIIYRSHSPILCREVANLAAEVLGNRYTENKQSGVGDRREFISNQLQRYKTLLDSSEERLKIFKSATQITSINRHSEDVMRRLTEAELQMDRLNTQIQTIREDLKTVDIKLTEQQTDIVPEAQNLGTDWAQVLRKKQIDLSVQFQDLKMQGYPDDHPKMVDLQKEISTVRTELSKKVKELAETQNALDPILQLQKFVQQKLDMQLQLESLQAQKNSVQSNIDRYSSDLRALPDKEFSLARLIRERDLNEKIYTQLLERHEQAKIAFVEETKSVRIIDKAYVPFTPISPVKSVNLVVGVLLGTILGLMTAFLLEFKNNTIRSHTEIERITGWPIIATIPGMDKFSKGKFKSGNAAKATDQERTYRALISSLEPHTVIAESYRMLRTNLQFAGIGREHRTILVTSLNPGDGKTTTLTNLAVTFAGFGNKTLVIDSDLRIPRGHTIYGVSKEMGVTDLLVALNDLDNILARPKMDNHSAETEAPIANGNGKPAAEAEDDSTALARISVDDISDPTFDAGTDGPSMQRSRKQGRIVGQVADDAREDEQEDKDSQAEAVENEEHQETQSPREGDRLLPIRELFRRVIKPTNIKNLDFISSGKKLTDPSQFLSIKSMPIILQKFGNMYNNVLIDSGPLLLVDETLMLSGIVDAVVVVLNPDRCNPNVLAQAKKMLDSANANVLGVVLNNCEVNKQYSQYYNYYDSDEA